MDACCGGEGPLAGCQRGVCEALLGAEVGCGSQIWAGAAALGMAADGTCCCLAFRCQAAGKGAGAEPSAWAGKKGAGACCADDGSQFGLSAILLPADCLCHLPLRPHNRLVGFIAVSG